MTEIDWLIAAVLVLSCIVGMMRGVIREIVAILGWVAGIMCAFAFAGDLAEKIPLPSLGHLPRVLIASVVIVVGSLFVFGLFGALLRKMLEVAALTFEDRAFGAVFGFVRGVVVVCGFVFFFGMIQSVQTSKLWRQSILVAPAEAVLDFSMPYLPQWLQDMRGGNAASLPTLPAGLVEDPVAELLGSQTQKK